MTDISRIVKIWNKSPVPVFNACIFIFKKIPKIYLRRTRSDDIKNRRRTFLDDTMGSIFLNFD